MSIIRVVPRDQALVPFLREWGLFFFTESKTNMSFACEASINEKLYLGSVKFVIIQKKKMWVYSKASVGSARCAYDCKKPTLSHA